MPLEAGHPLGSPAALPAKRFGERAAAPPTQNYGLHSFNFQHARTILICPTDDCISFPFLYPFLVPTNLSPIERAHESLGLVSIPIRKYKVSSGLFLKFESVRVSEIQSKFIEFQSI